MDDVEVPQPDFNRVVACHNAMAEHHNAVAEEMQKVQNVPALAGGQAILNALDALTTRMDAFDALATRMAANDNNAISRSQNIYARDANSPLAELHNSATNRPIPNFPATSRDIDQLQLGAANAILSALDQGTAGTLPMKKQRIRVLLGLPAVRVTSAGP